MSEIREDCLYAKTHEWVRVDGDIAVCGISDYAQSELGELVFVELPELGEEVKADDDVCVVESVKSASDVYTPVSGTIVEVNEVLLDKPNLLNESPYDDGWLYKIRLDDEECDTDLATLLSAESYAQKITE